MTIKKTYKVEETCDNCWKTIELEIPFGVTVRDFCSRKTCPFCGCSIYRKKPSI